MKAYVAKCAAGVFAFDENGRLLGCQRFPMDATAVVKKMEASPRGLIDEESMLIRELGSREVVIEKEANISGLNVQNPNGGGEFLRSRIDEVVKDYYTRSEYLALLHDVSVSLAERRVKEALQRKDVLVIQAVRSLDSTDEALNLLSERINEWYVTQYPMEDKNKRKELAKENYVLVSFSNEIESLRKFRKELETCVEKEVGEIAPNTSSLAGPLLAARLIADSNGLMNLAVMPGSKIQVMGAEKALFRRTKTKKASPKHGTIFQHPLVKSSPWWQRGKIARCIAGKIAIAARLDVFSDRYLAEKLKEDVQKKVSEIRSKYPNEPRRKKWK